MHKFFLLALLLFISCVHNCYAQQLPITRNIEKAIAKGTRSDNGLPGKLYWQNRSNYTIKVNFSPATLELKGSVGIDYTNNSTDTLSSLVFKLYPNLYKAEAMRNMQIDASDLGKGVLISSLKIDTREVESGRQIIRGTNMFVKGCKLLPGQKVHIDILYSYHLNKGSFIRTGQIDSGSFFIAYFFPRIAVYDDIDGWNEFPYIGKEEFYNDYGDFYAELTLPSNYQVWATGDLKNRSDMYSPEILQRLKFAELNDSVADIITQKDLKEQNISNIDSAKTWIFEAGNVTDFAFAASNHYVWKASSIMVDPATKRRTRVDAVFNPQHTTYFPVAAYARKTVDLMSYQFPAAPFPYSHITIVDGLDAMEYPMMINNLPFEDPKDVIEFTAHEVFHSLFPFYVANNETKNSFMDEGWATLTEFMFHPMIDSTVPVNYDISPVNLSAGTEEDMPVMTPTPQLYGKARFADKDLKPALAFWYLKEMLGDKLFAKALQGYITTWAGKHPTPFDFFNSMNAGSGLNLNWFWKNWFFEKNIPDLAIQKITHRQLDYTVIVSSPGTLYVPIHLKIFYKNGSKEIISKNISCWAKSREPVTLKFKAKMPIKQIVLGDDYDVDINPGNNKIFFKASL